MRRRVVLPSDDESSGEFDDDFDEREGSSSDVVTMEPPDDATEGGDGEVQSSAPAANTAFEEMMDEPSDSPMINAPTSPPLDGVEVVDLTDSIGLEGIMETQMSKRSRTTMENLSSMSYQNRGAYGKTTSTYLNTNVDQDGVRDQYAQANGNLTISESYMRKSAQQDLNQRSFTTTQDSIPSSREIFPIGSKLPPNAQQNSDQSFRTQTTIPFTASTQDYVAPMVVTPAAEPTSSAALNGNIDEISDFLQQDIVNTKALLRSVSEDIPSTDSNPGAVEIVTTVPDGFESDKTPTKDAVSGDDLVETLSVAASMSEREATPSAPRDKLERTKDRSFREDNDGDSEDFEVGAPKEMYKPRPSKSRSKGKRAGDNLDVSASPNGARRSQNGREKTKRRKTDSDTHEDPINVDSWESNHTPKSKKTGKSGNSFESSIVEELADAHGPEMSDPDSTVRVDKKRSEDTVQVVSNEKPATGKTKAPKKKRGRPKKSQKQVKHSEGDETRYETPQPDKDDVSIDERCAEQDLDDNQITISKPDGMMVDRKRYRVSVLDDSEDELAADESWKANASDGESKQDAEPAKEVEPEPKVAPQKKAGKRGRKPKAAAAAEVEDGKQEQDDTVNTEHIEKQASPEPAPKKTGKRGRKPKKPAPKSGDPEEETNVETKATETDETGASTLDSATAATSQSKRPPLRDKSNEMNKSKVIDETDEEDDETANTEKQASAPLAVEERPPETPQQQKGQQHVVENLLLRSGPIRTSSNVRYRIGLSKRSSVAPLLKIVRRDQG